MGNLCGTNFVRFDKIIGSRVVHSGTHYQLVNTNCYIFGINYGEEIAVHDDAAQSFKLLLSVSGTPGASGRMDEPN